MQIYHEHVQYSTVQYRSNCVYGQGLSEIILIKFILHSSQNIHLEELFQNSREQWHNFELVSKQCKFT